MSHFAKVEDGVVTQVIVAEQDVIDSGLFGTGWIQTSFNTHGGKHYGNDGKPDGGVALRGNFAGIGYTYDATDDVFYPIKLFDSWIKDKTTYSWRAPVDVPEDGKNYDWDELTRSWVEI
jgi:hypothetical protein